MSSTTHTGINTGPNIDALLSSVTTIGRETRAAKDLADVAADDNNKRLGAARDDVDDDKRASSGFNAPRFKGMSRTAGEFGRFFNDPTTPAARTAMDACAEAFSNAFTDRTDKSKLGGFGANLGHAIGLGSACEDVRVAMQDRLDEWQSVKDSAKGDATPSGRDNLAQALRFLVPCASCPQPDGSLPTKGKGADAKPFVPKHTGRPERTIKGVVVPGLGGGTNRDSQFAQLCRLYGVYGREAIHPDVVDGVLDNGGRYSVDVNTVEQHASDAQQAVDKLLLLAGTSSRDVPSLTMLSALLARIAKSGLKPNKPVADVIPVEPVVIPIENQSVGDDVDAALDAAQAQSDAIAGTAGEPALADAATPIAVGRPRRAKPAPNDGSRLV